MYKGRTWFAQTMGFLGFDPFRRCLRRDRGGYKVRAFSWLEQFLSMALAQLACCEGLRGHPILPSA